MAVKIIYNNNTPKATVAIFSPNMFFNWTKSPAILPGLLDFFSDKRIPPLFLSRALNFHTKQLYHFLPVNTRKRKRKVCEQSWKL